MLQINSGKLYPGGVLRTNKLRGVLYSNITFYSRSDEAIFTEAGSLMPTDPTGVPKPLVYEVTERFDDNDTAQPGKLISHSIQAYLDDFSTVVSFYLRVTCTPQADLCQRLLSGSRSLGIMTPPNKLIRRVFDKDVWLQPSDAENLKSFVHDLIGLRRKNFLVVMRAIRTYVTGIHRISDDLETAYTLLVASIESLAQEFDGHQAVWADYEDLKRRPIDKALVDADEVTAERVRAALLKIEHKALARRFRDFALDMIPKDSPFDSDRVAVPGRLDLRDALKEAYRLRSRYVHNLADLPRLLDTDLSFAETIRPDRLTFLTLEGLARVARTIILEFVAKEPKVATEVYDYRLERYGIMTLRMAPTYWIGNPDALTPNGGRDWLEGFLSELGEAMLSGGSLTTQKDVLPKMEEMFPNLDHDQMRPMLAAYILFNRFAPSGHASPAQTATIGKYQGIFAAPSVEALVLYSLLDLEMPAHWDVERHRSILEQYFEMRNRKLGIRVPELFEAVMILTLAERFREAGDIASTEQVLSFGRENLPNYLAFREFLGKFDAEVPINWEQLLPRSAATQSQAPDEELTSQSAGVEVEPASEENPAVP